MLIRMSSTAMVFALATVLGAQSASESQNADNIAQVDAINAVFMNESLSRDKQTTEDLLKMTRDFSNGEKSAEFIQNELTKLAGDEPVVKWNSQNIKSRYKLSQIITHVQDLESDFELLHQYTFADGSIAEDESTQYTNKIYAADEQNLTASIVFSRFIQPREEGPTFEEKSRALYTFLLKPNDMRGNFGLRPPEGTHSIDPATAQSFDPLAQLNFLNSAFDEIGEYQYEMPLGEKIFNVTISPRLTEIETLTIEVEIREVNSIITNTFVLVYESL